MIDPRNRKAQYYSMVGSNDGLIMNPTECMRVKDLNRIYKHDWIRWQGPPSKAMSKALKNAIIFPAAQLYPDRKIF